MKLYCVFGNPIFHSKSPLLHNYVFYKLNIDARYTRFHLESSANFRELFFEYGFSGANITLPFKEELICHCDSLSPLAKKINAINTIVREDSKLIGYNTDAMGFYKNIENEDIKNALIIGAGGSAKAVAWILRDKNIDTCIINRSPNKLEYFRDAGFSCFSNDSFKGGKFDLIINATSSSINNTLPLQKEALEELFSHSKIAFDLMYGKVSSFLELSKRHNLATIDGSKMLLYQAIEANSLFLNMDYRMIEEVMSEAYCL